jgi:hypothetical protein
MALYKKILAVGFLTTLYQLFNGWLHIGLLETFGCYMQHDIYREIKDPVLFPNHLFVYLTLLSQ